MKKTVDYYYSYNILDKNDAFEVLAYIAMAVDQKFFMYVYVDGGSRRVIINDDIKKEYDSIGINN